MLIFRDRSSVKAVRRSHRRQRLESYLLGLVSGLRWRPRAREMEKHLRAFREIPTGMNIRNVFTREWAMAVQDAITALAAGENITTDGDMTRLPGEGKVRLGTRPRFKAFGTRQGRFLIRYNPANKRLSVGKGSAYTDHTWESRQQIKPHTPVLRDAAGVDYWVGPFEADTEINIWCVTRNYYTSEMVMLSDAEELDLEDSQNAVLVATVIFTGGRRPEGRHLTCVVVRHRGEQIVDDNPS